MTRSWPSVTAIAAPCVVVEMQPISASAANSVKPARIHFQIRSTSKCG